MASLGFNDFDSVLFGLSNSQVNLFVKAARTQDGGIQQIRTISSPNNKYLVRGGSIHLLKKLSDDAVHHLIRISTIPSLGYQCIKLVHKNNAWATRSRSLKNSPYILFTLTNVHIQQLRTLHTNEIHFALFSHTFSQESFACARRPVKQQSCSGLYPFIEYFGMFDGQQNCLYNLFLGCLQASDIVPAYLYQVLYLLLLHQFSKFLKDLVLLQRPNMLP